MPTATTSQEGMGTASEEAKQRYETAKKALKAGIAKKRQIDRTLTDLESQIFLFEGSYLASTSTSGGNIVKGFDGYLKSHASSSGHGGRSSLANSHAHAMTPNDIPVEDRMFSQSSATYARSLQLKANEARSREQSPAQSSTTTTKKGGEGGKGDKPSTAAVDETPSKKASKGDKTAKAEKSSKKDKEEDRSTEVVVPPSSGGGKKDKQSAVESTPSKGKKREREKEAGATVPGSSKKKQRKDDE